MREFLIRFGRVIATGVFNTVLTDQQCYDVGLRFFVIFGVLIGITVLLSAFILIGNYIVKRNEEKYGKE